MALTNVECIDVRSAISALLAEHIAYPFHVLRERGAVAELRQQLLSFSALNGSVDANVVRRNPRLVQRNLLQEFTAAVRRVQLELTVRKPLHVRGAQFRKDIDIGILAANPTLQLEKNGPGDVIQQMETSSVAAAFEVKASCSADVAERGKYVVDLQALLRLKSEGGPDGFFVLMDKSLGHYGAWTGGTPIAWQTDAEQEILLRSKPPKRFHSLREANLRISSNAPEEGADSVDLWTMCETDGEWQPTMLYVTWDRKPDAVPLPDVSADEGEEC